jgi:uncharacterized LabA/DUF88 family protein
MAAQDVINQSQKKLAVLFDGENISPQRVSIILDEIAKFGTTNIKRVYGDWTSSSMNSWKAILHKFSLLPIQQFTYTYGKNSTDSALIIDAMDILHSNIVDGFCIISSDSDYTRLAMRMKESGLVVYGIGELKTPEPFRQACNQFIFIENLEPREHVTFTDDIQELVLSAVEDAADEEGWAFLSQVGIILRNKKPDFDYRTYGYRRLGELVKEINFLEIRYVHPRGTEIPDMQVRKKVNESGVT